MKNSDCISPALWKASQLEGANGRLNSGEISGGNIKSLVVVANKEVKDRVARTTGHGLYNLVSERSDTRVTNGNGVEGLQVVDEVKGAALLLDAKER